MPQMTIKPAFEIGSMIYLKSDPFQKGRTIVGYHVYCNGINYEVRLSEDEATVHTLAELSHEKGEVDPQSINKDEEE
jgi:hypothetical protein